MTKDRTRRVLLVTALFLSAEAMIVLTHPQEAKALMRKVYQTLWYYAPKPDGYIPPDRFR